MVRVNFFSIGVGLDISITGCEPIVGRRHFLINFGVDIEDTFGHLVIGLAGIIIIEPMRIFGPGGDYQLNAVLEGALLGESGGFVVISLHSELSRRQLI